MKLKEWAEAVDQLGDEEEIMRIIDESDQCPSLFDMMNLRDALLIQIKNAYSLPQRRNQKPIPATWLSRAYEYWYRRIEEESGLHNIHFGCWS